MLHRGRLSCVEFDHFTDLTLVTLNLFEQAQTQTKHISEIGEASKAESPTRFTKPELVLANATPLHGSWVHFLHFNGAHGITPALGTKNNHSSLVIYFTVITYRTQLIPVRSCVIYWNHPY